MSTAVKKTISLPTDLAREVEETARAEGKSVSAIVQEALRSAKGEARRRQYQAIQGYWSTVARQKGILTEQDLLRYLDRGSAPGT